jgi:hypothetical protein
MVPGKEANIVYRPHQELKIGKFVAAANHMPLGLHTVASSHEH